MATEHCYRVAGRDLALTCIPKAAATSMIEALGLQAPCLPQHALRDGYFVAAFVRHPLDRLVSAWADKTTRTTPHLLSLGFHDGMSFPEFVCAAEQVAPLDHHLRPQSAFLLHRGRLCADFIGRFERLTQDWARLSAIFSLPQIQHANRSTRTRDWRSYYDADTLDRARRIYTQDLELLGYAVPA